MNTEDSQVELFQKRILKDVNDHFRVTTLQRTLKYQDRPKAKYTASEYDPDAYHVALVDEIPNVDTVIAEPQKLLSGFDSSFIDSLRFVQYRFQNHNRKELLAFRVYPKTKFLSRNRGSALIFSDDALEFSKKDMVVTDEGIDCIVFGDEVLIFQVKSFEKIFDYKKIHAENLEKVFGYLGKGVDGYKIPQLDELKQQCMKDFRKVRKMSSILEKNLYRTIDINKLTKFVSDYKIDDVRIDPTRKVITFENSNSLLHLLNDDNLKSDLTSDKYRTYGKKRI